MWEGQHCIEYLLCVRHCSRTGEQNGQVSCFLGSLHLGADGQTINKMPEASNC